MQGGDGWESWVSPWAKSGFLSGSSEFRVDPKGTFKLASQEPTLRSFETVLLVMDLFLCSKRLLCLSSKTNGGFESRVSTMILLYVSGAVHVCFVVRYYSKVA